jgi:hypothetical protein
VSHSGHATSMGYSMEHVPPDAITAVLQLCNPSFTIRPKTGYSCKDCPQAGTAGGTQLFMVALPTKRRPPIVLIIRLIIRPEYRLQGTKSRSYGDLSRPILRFHSNHQRGTEKGPRPGYTYNVLMCSVRFRLSTCDDSLRATMRNEPVS